NFRELDDKIINAEDDNKKTILEDISNSLVNDKIWEHFPGQNKVSEANLRKRKERAIKIFKLFDGVGGEEKIYCIKFFSVSTILRLGVDDIDYVKAKFNDAFEGIHSVYKIRIERTSLTDREISCNIADLKRQLGACSSPFAEELQIELNNLPESDLT
ncbi:16352_t:CDS:2, partial [Dentiscutata heterogama]